MQSTAEMIHVDTRTTATALQELTTRCGQLDAVAPLCRHSLGPVNHVEDRFVHQACGVEFVAHADIRGTAEMHERSAAGLQVELLAEVESSMPPSARDLERTLQPCLAGLVVQILETFSGVQTEPGQPMCYKSMLHFISRLGLIDSLSVVTLPGGATLDGLAS